MYMDNPNELYTYNFLNKETNKDFHKNKYKDVLNQLKQVKHCILCNKFVTEYCIIDYYPICFICQNTDNYTFQ